MNDTDQLLQEVLEATKKKTNWCPLIIGGFCFIAFWILNWWYAIRQETPGQFGDMFGASNSLFSGLALAAVAYSLWLQRKDLEIQRNVTILSVRELKNSVEAQLGSAEAQKEQVKAMKMQTNATKNQTQAITQQNLITVQSSRIQAYTEIYSVLRSLPKDSQGDHIVHNQSLLLAKRNMEKAIEQLERIPLN